MVFSALQIAQALQGEILGNSEVVVSDVSPIENGKEGTLSFLGDKKYLPYLAETKSSIVLISKDIEFSGSTNATIIRVPNARGAMAELLRIASAAMNPRKQGIEQPCYIADGVDIPEDAYIGAFTYIGKGATIGKAAQIYPNCYIGENAHIGEDSILYAGVKIYANCRVGNHCILHSGVVVGADGFGFEPDEKGINRKVPQIGNAIIEDDVEIGANTTIDKAMMGSTIVHRNVKIDNLVQVAHNVEIGESTILCAQVGIAGSTKIGSHCILAGQVGVAGHIEVADGCIVGAQTGIAGSLRQAGKYQGSPAIDAMNFRRSSVVFKHLPELQKDIDNIKKALNK